MSTHDPQTQTITYVLAENVRRYRAVSMVVTPEQREVRDAQGSFLWEP